MQRKQQNGEQDLAPGFLGSIRLATSVGVDRPLLRTRTVLSSGLSCPAHPETSWTVIFSTLGTRSDCLLCSSSNSILRFRRTSSLVLLCALTGADVDDGDDACAPDVVWNALRIKQFRFGRAGQGLGSQRGANRNCERAITSLRNDFGQPLPIPEPNNKQVHQH